MKTVSTKFFYSVRLVALWMVAGVFVPALAQVAIQGQWATLPTLMPINPVHMALLHNGKVLIVSGSGNVPSNTSFAAALFDPQTGTITTQPLAWDMFCNGMAILPDGRPLVVGGTLQYDPFFGQLATSAYDPQTGTFTDQASMAHGRWYPTVMSLGDGTLLTFSGLDETGATNTAVEIFTPGTGWSIEFPAPWTPPLYPRMHLLPNGTVFYSGSTTSSNIFVSGAWMLWLGGKQLLQDRNGPSFVRHAVITLRRQREQRKCVEGGSVGILRITLMQMEHRLGIGLDA